MHARDLFIILLRLSTTDWYKTEWKKKIGRNPEWIWARARLLSAVQTGGNYKFPRVQILNRPVRTENVSLPLAVSSLYRVQRRFCARAILDVFAFSGTPRLTVTTPFGYTKGTWMICQPSSTGLHKAYIYIFTRVDGEMVISAVDVVAGDFFFFFHSASRTRAEMRIRLERKSVSA